MHSDARAYFSHVMRVDNCMRAKIFDGLKYNVFEIKENTNLYQGWDRATTYTQTGRGGHCFPTIIITACGIWQGIILNILFHPEQGA